MEAGKKILLLDGGNQNALAIVRHLGLLGYSIDVVAYNKLSPACYSKFARKIYITSSPKKNANKFYSELISILGSKKYFFLMPVGYSTFETCMKHKTEIKKYTNVVLTSEFSFEIASSKKKTYEFAREHGIPCPEVFPVVSVEDFHKYDFNYPLVIKAPFEMGKNVVEYAYSKEDAISKYKCMCERYHFEYPNLPVVQEFIRGEGYGFFAYYEEGVCKRTFMHRRIRENPPSGGVSTCAESFRDENLFSLGKKILDLLKWNGVAMVEFKKDVNSGVYKLMEINPKFWGSLELAIVSEVNFPQFLVMRTEGREISYNDKFEYRKFQWLLNGELFHLCSKPSSFLRIIKDLFVSKKDFWWSDIAPSGIQLLLIFTYYFKKLFANDN